MSVTLRRCDLNAKAKGTRAEHKSRRLLEAAGYRMVRSGGSLGEWDLVGCSTTGWVVVQVKTNRSPGALERRALAEWPAPPGTLKLIHVWRDYRRTPEVEEVP
jgi:hypothetical protein